MSAQILEFPGSIRIEHFESQAAVRSSIRTALAAACGVFQRDPTEDECQAFLDHLTNAVHLFDVYRELRGR